MFFGDNCVRITGPAASFSLCFSAEDALAAVSKTAAAVPVQIAPAKALFWKQRSDAHAIYDYDWTFTPLNYHDRLPGWSARASTASGINYARLKRRDPIRFFDENILYEDELGDNGTSSVSVRIRVMDYGFYCLLGHFLRVDQVAFRATTTRYYHEFASRTVFREIRHAEDSYESVLTVR